jgi:hypothetical protein
MQDIRRYRRIQLYAAIYKGIQWHTVVYNGVSERFLRGDLLTETLNIPLSLVYPGSVRGWVSFKE